ncbi:hypothetical protein [Mucilaginibacter puniceus]
METDYIKIPLPDFSFSNHIKKEAKTIIHTYLQEGNLLAVSKGYEENLKITKDEIQMKSYDYDSSEKVIFITEFLMHLTELKSKEKFKYIGYSNVSKVPPEKVRDDDYYETIEDLQVFLYRLARPDYEFDKNTFTTDEFVDITQKLDDITYQLKELKAGQEVLYNEFEEIKNQIKADFESLKSDPPLGKKRFLKITLGTISSYAGNKIADEIFAQLRPQIIALLTIQAPHLLEKFMKLIGQ